MCFAFTKQKKNTTMALLTIVSFGFIAWLFSITKSVFWHYEIVLFHGTNEFVNQYRIVCNSIMIGTNSDDSSLYHSTQTINWSNLEPVDKENSDLVWTHRPKIYIRCFGNYVWRVFYRQFWTGQFKHISQWLNWCE